MVSVCNDQQREISDQFPRGSRQMPSLGAYRPGSPGFIRFRGPEEEGNAIVCFCTTKVSKRLTRVTLAFRSRYDDVFGCS